MARSPSLYGSFLIRQVDLAITALRERATGGAPPLLILPSHYTSSTVVPNHTRSNKLNETHRHVLTAEERATVTRWVEEGHVWSCLDGSNDDW